MLPAMKQRLLPRGRHAIKLLSDMLGKSSREDMREFQPAKVVTICDHLRLLRFASDGLLGFGAVHDGRLPFRLIRYGAASSLTWKPISGLSCSGDSPTRGCPRLTAFFARTTGRTFSWTDKPFSDGLSLDRAWVTRVMMVDIYADI